MMRGKTIWPNITVKRDAMPEAKEMDGVEGKYEQFFSPNPGRIRGEFKIDLPRPRDINSPSLAEHAQQIMAALKGMEGDAPREVAE